MSEIQKGRPTIYGEVQSPRRRTGRPGVPAYSAESQRRYAGRMTEHYDNAQMEGAGRPALGNRARTEQAPRRRASVPAPEAYTAPFDRPARGWENMPEQELRRTDFASDRKLRVLWSVFGILAVLLVAAIIYEVVLGNGLKETGGQRMAGRAGTQTTGQTTAQTNAASSDEDLSAGMTLNLIPQHSVIDVGSRCCIADTDDCSDIRSSNAGCRDGRCGCRVRQCSRR